MLSSSSKRITFFDKEVVYAKILQIKRNFYRNLLYSNNRYKQFFISFSKGELALI